MQKNAVWFSENLHIILKICVAPLSPSFVSFAFFHILRRSNKQTKKKSEVVIYVLELLYSKWFLFLCSSGFFTIHGWWGDHQRL